MSLFQTIKSALERNDADSAFTALQKASNGKLDSVFANNQRMRFYKVGEVDQFYDELFTGVVQSAVYAMPTEQLSQFEKGMRYQRLSNDYALLNLAIDDCTVLVVY
ncbi:hypothetical protein ABV111_001080 [Salmonella enterica subsp. enterica serovar Newport]|jgi:hypothetical protein|nr:hypothetical protein [Salmonella enterica subsp. enterica serovar Virchow]EDD9881545.1 hypothetical protein [Salmonella enterica subsp. enterica serovar Enteritidis]EDF0012867.1 hypothetical protein [Salmonella enterica subsp. enterica serovar Enteritidis]EDJ3473762.1 hypothetical protein [Salmonella enterica subsp. enterica serovar Enteritidis]EEE8893798.1 hypothetical protein [Salmonella enterica subsp. enterica serovar Enteritidis]